MIAGPPAVCDGAVFHYRRGPREHSFRYDVNYLWLDPDRPDELCDRHPLWSSRRPAPARFRSSDYGDGSDRPLGEQVRADLEPVLGHRPNGPVRMLTQLRRWGWLFNPITVYFAWELGGVEPIAAVLEVTNTPWKERHRYPIRLDHTDGHFRAQFPKSLHVSPFLDESFDYRLDLVDLDNHIDLSIDVIDRESNESVLTTRLDASRRQVDHEQLATALFTNVAPTHRVSLGIHAQAARLLAKRVPFVPHPRARKASAP